MRKFLVASQKSGVGKTTTSMNLAAATALNGTRVLLLDADPLGNIGTALNLAEHPHRQSLRQVGIKLPGTIVTNIVPGLDILSPYGEGCCSDDDLDHLLEALSALSCEQCYGCMIVDVPPFMGANPAQLIGSCDEYLLVMRAEAMAYRTLSAFLELVQRSGRDDHAIQMRGILLTLPEGDEPGCRWERELRGRFGARILPEVIPYDETISKALCVGQISSQLHPDSPAARAYRALVSRLGLAEELRPAAAAEQVIQALREAAGAVQTALVATTASASDPLPETADHSEEVDFFAPPPDPEARKLVAPSSRVRRLSRSGQTARVARPVSPASPSLSPSGRTKTVAASAAPLSERDNLPPALPVATPVPSPNILGQLWPLWILLGVVIGGGVRFVSLDPAMLPIVVGLGVALLVVVVLRSITTTSANAVSPSEDNTRGQHSRDRKKGSALSALAKGMLRNTRRDPYQS